MPGARRRPVQRSASSREPVPVTALTVRGARAWRRKWDLQQARWIADREERFATMLEALEQGVGSRFVCLDLGCGTGSLSERILRRFPHARTVAIDHDPVLMTIGRVGLGDFRGRLTWLDADLRRKDWAGELPARRFDAAVSTTALHWFTGAELGRLYEDLARVIRPGGWFLNGDHIAFSPADAELHRTSRAILKRRARRAGSAGASWSAWWRAALADPHLTPEAQLHRVRYPHSHSGTPTLDLDGHLARLRAAGFREARLIWTRWENRVIAAVR
jgi:SAM-dependent methyltransferase